MDLTTSGELSGILNVLSFMAEAESALAELYHVCGEAWQDTRAFWSGIEEEENRHARNIERMKDIITQKPERFERGRPFNIVAVQTFVKGIRGNTEKVRTGALQRRNALFLARDLEQSIMEQRYGEIVKTGDTEYLGLMKEIISDTVTHKARIDAEIKNLN
ncbi:MAG: hypothetical protein GXX82_04790 [Syntrophorhabdus sp.]|jgi:rubrerythrin|nr:hypothetical protein [Syntrophorhabdus sp.]